MKICLACSARFEGPGWSCPVCAFLPPTLDGFPAFAPDLEAGAPHYPDGVYDHLFALEADHFWFRARNRLVIWALQTNFPGTRNFLEIGCGTGFVLSGVQNAFPDLRVTGSEIFASGLVHAERRLPGVELLQMDARAIPFEGEFDVIGAFDVLEHIQEDDRVLGEIGKALKPGGGLLVTVPQHPFLWSSVDEFAQHVRRYRRKELRRKVEAAGFEVLRTTSFVSLLLPLMLLSRGAKRSGKVAAQAEPELEIPAFLNGLFSGVSALEDAIIRSGLSLPAGGSLLLAARKAR